MKLIKTLILSLISVISISAVNANETSFGLGAAIDSEIKIYLPIKTTNYLIEPSILIFTDNEKRTDDTSSQKSDFNVKEFGVGIFKNTNVYDKTYIYYGARIGYIETESKNSFGSSTNTTKENGYFIAPTIGAEYRLTKNFSIGLDISFNYSDTDGTTTTDFNNSTDVTNIESTQYKTESEVVVRYQF